MEINQGNINVSFPIDFHQQSIHPSLNTMELVYAIFESLVAACSTVGNSLILVSFVRAPRLRTPTNLYVFSLALADLLVSVVGIPVYLYSMITNWPSEYRACLVVNTWIMTLCTVSIFHLVAVSFDRYMAVVWLRQPNSRAKGIRQAAYSITVAWFCGTVIGFLPLMGWNRGPSTRGVCVFLEIMDMRYLMFLFYATIIAPTLVMGFFYASIFCVVHRQDKKMTRRSGANESNRDSTKFEWETLQSSSLRSNRCSYLVTWSRSERSFVSSSSPYQTDQNRSLYRRSTRRKRETKSTRVIRSFLLVILSFLMSWYPLYTLNAITYYAPRSRIDQSAFYVCIVLSHVSTTVNPLIYARTMPGFKEALLDIMRCKEAGL